MFRLGVIGCGRIVEDAHAPALAALSDQAQIVALADPSAERRDAIAKLATAPVTGYGDWREMLKRERLDAAVVAVPHHLHLSAITDVAAAGVDVISEKPLANTVDEVDEIGRAIAKAGVRLSVMHNWMYNPDAQAAIKAAASGRIGDPFLVRNESLLGVAWKSKDPSGDWRKDPRQSGGGIVIDGVYHPIYGSEAEHGSPVVRVFAANRGEGEVEDTAVIVLEHANGGIASIQRCHNAKGGGSSAHEIHGSRGSIRFRQSDPLIMNRVMAGEAPPGPAPGSPPPPPALEIFEDATTGWQAIDVPAGPWWSGIQTIFKLTFEAWATGENAPVGLADARHVLEVVAAIYDSAERSEAVEISTGPAA